MDISQINRGENNAKGQVWGSSALHLLCCPPSPPTTKRGDVRAFLHVCAHLCTLAILQSARSLLVSHNYQSSHNPTSNCLPLLQHWNMAYWKFDNLNMSISAQYFCLVLYFFCLMFSWSACWTMFYLGFASKAHPPLLTENLPPSCQDVRVLGRACTHSIGQACKKKWTTKPRTALILQQITVFYGKNKTHSLKILLWLGQSPTDWQNFRNQDWNLNWLRITQILQLT